MDKAMGAALDRYITGNYGEDQFKVEEEWFEFLEYVCDHCVMHLLDQCPVDESEPGAVENCLVVQTASDKLAEEDSKVANAMYQMYLEGNVETSRSENYL